ncbi:DUF4402 domain-containing protein [Desulfogranum japonicum]|uniref:DUF4402 domain-containing protein n=1 Tax=Desulfogranum japonicum TaxID=231447 RepID=UPI00048A6691|nr:DUF4402 domain-containing protein [Desulfogranum japonicum]
MSPLIFNNLTSNNLQHILFALFCCIISLISSSAYAVEEIRLNRSIEFGDIIFQPGGDTVTIDASDGGTVSPHVEKGLLRSGGHSGLLIIRLEQEAEVQINYPDSIILKNKNNGAELTVQDIRQLSEYSSSILEHPGYNQEIEASIGGRLSISSGSAEGSYQGEGIIYIQITYL